MASSFYLVEMYVRDTFSEREQSKFNLAVKYWNRLSPRMLDYLQKVSEQGYEYAANYHPHSFGFKDEYDLSLEPL